MSAPINRPQFYQEHPHFRPQIDGMAKRMIVELFLKIVCNFWRTLGSYFLKIPLSDRTAALDKAPHTRQQIKKGSYGESLVRELKHKRTLGPASFVEYSQKVLIPQNDNLEVVNNFLFNVMNSDLPDVSEEKDLIFLPVVLKSGIRDHIVSVVFDKTRNRVELYDSKGLVALDRPDLVRNTDRLMLVDLLMKVIDKYGNGETELWENTTKHQKDSHNCGIYVLDYIERRLQGYTAEEIAANGLSFSEANTMRRDVFLKAYYESLPEEALVPLS